MYLAFIHFLHGQPLLHSSDINPNHSSWGGLSVLS